MLSNIRKIILKKIPSPFGTSSLYWMDLIPFAGYFLIRHFDLHLQLKSANPLLAKLLVLLLPLIFAIPVVDLWPKAYGASDEGMPAEEQEHYRRSVRKRLGAAALVALVLFLYG